MTFCNLLEFYTIGLIDDIPLIDGTRYVKVLYPLAFGLFTKTNKQGACERINMHFIYCVLSNF
jgi:hypothetical protein